MCELGSFRIFGVAGKPARRQRYGELGSFRVIEVAVGVNWVRFAEIWGGGTVGMLKLGSFRFFWVAGDPRLKDRG